ncbi:flagellar motor protein MotB [Sphingomonas jeddahensis]|uniref:Chemotaxis protein LafU n=1 Tax=Sphingomonas jeddahensis TaxID=1915074 RepID=A0A1V2EVQ7_9SPHN|nr:flagellar motor protein MotB [Sphingomonas jeddahensis]ONF96761.1 Chemotaxis protein LafU [Sphingomonas jeddahensis]
MAARAPHGANQPPKIIVKKIYIEGHGGHHGGAWKVAYADFVTAMMAFFLLMWLLGATTEKQRKGIADYFAPTILNTKSLGIGGGGLLGGQSVTTDQRTGPHDGNSRMPAIVSRPDGTGGPQMGTGKKGSLRSREAIAAEDRQNFAKLKQQVEQQLKERKSLAALAKHIRFTMTPNGMRIDLVDDADYSMFGLGTTALESDAASLIGMVAEGIRATQNPIMIRGHTDSLPYGDPRAMNNWMLATGRAEATRRRLALGGIPENRFHRIEGVADREPMIVDNPQDPRNRRVAITLLYRAGAFGQ